jgi:hypothetical protein
MNRNKYISKVVLSSLIKAARIVRQRINSYE